MLDLTHQSRSNCPSSRLFAGIWIKTDALTPSTLRFPSRYSPNLNLTPRASIFCLTTGNNQGTLVQALRMEKMWRCKAAEGGGKTWSRLFLSIQQFCFDVWLLPWATADCVVSFWITQRKSEWKERSAEDTRYTGTTTGETVNLPTSRLLCFPLQTFPVPSPPTLFFFPLLSACWKNTDENGALLTSLPQKIFQCFLKIFHQPNDLVCWCCSNWIICVYLWACCDACSCSGTDKQFILT